MNALGLHRLIDLYGCDPDRLADADAVRVALLDAARRAGATVVTQHFHQFEPHGVSGVVVIAESHLTIHTWPEYHCAAADLFTCGETIDSDYLVRLLKESFSAQEVRVNRVERGTGVREKGRRPLQEEVRSWPLEAPPKSSS